MSLLLEKIKEIYFKIAFLCNHQKTSSSNNEKKLEKIKNIKNLIDKIKKSNLNDDTKKLKIDKLKIKNKLLNDNNDYWMNTSKENYIDPRII